MAARKSCTHITWNEAKAKSGLLSSNNTTSKNNNNKKKISHGDALTAKVVAKHTGESNKTYHQSAQLERKIQRRQEERMAKITAQRLEMKERERAEQTIQPYEQAKIRIQHKLWEYATTTIHTSTTSMSTMEPLNDKEWKKLIVECKQLQLEEISALEAIFMDTKDFYVTESSQVDVLQEMLDDYSNHDNDESLFQAIFHHPPLTMLLQQNLEDDLSSDNFTRDSTHKELVLSALFRISFPPTYPMDGISVPQWEVLECYVTDKTMTCSPDKPLESLASLQVAAIQDAWNQEAQSILPDPIVYHIIGMWFPEHVWDDKYLTMSYTPSKR